MRQHGRPEEQDPDHALDDVGRLASRSPASRDSRASSRRTRFCGRPTARRWARTCCTRSDLTPPRMTAFYMWRLMNMTFYGKSRVKPEVQAHVHESPASMTVPLTLLAVGSVLAGWLGHCRNCGISASSFRALRELARAGVRVAARTRRPRRRGARHVGIEWILMGALGRRSRSSASSWRAYFYHIKPEIPESHRASLKPHPRTALQQVVRGRDLRFPVRQRTRQGRRPAARRVRPQRGGRRRERRGLADALQLAGVDLVGHLDRRRRGAARLVLREDALATRCASCRPAACRLTRCSSWSGRSRSSAITWRGKHMDQHLLSIILFAPLAGLLVLLFLIPASKRT